MKDEFILSESSLFPASNKTGVIKRKELTRSSGDTPPRITRRPPGRAASALNSHERRTGSAMRLADLPVVPKRVGDTSNTPTVFFANREDFRCSRGNGLLKHRVWVGDCQDHADR